VGNNMDVQIRIYDITGRLVTIVNEQVQGTSARINPIYWNGRNTDGSVLSAGLYIYSIFASNDQGETAVITSKFIVTR
jgi:flagellar hook assembly protein FlgD